jgi:hypothetical protein
MNLMFRIGLLNLTNFINISFIKYNVKLSTLIKFSNGYFIFNVYLNMVLILIKGVHSNITK